MMTEGQLKFGIEQLPKRRPRTTVEWIGGPHLRLGYYNGLDELRFVEGAPHDNESLPYGTLVHIGSYRARVVRWDCFRNEYELVREGAPLWLAGIHRSLSERYNRFRYRVKMTAFIWGLKKERPL